MQPNPPPNSLHLVSVFSPPPFVSASTPSGHMIPVGSSTDFHFIPVPPMPQEPPHGFVAVRQQEASTAPSAWIVSSSSAAGAWSGAPGVPAQNYEVLHHHHVHASQMLHPSGPPLRVERISEFSGHPSVSLSSSSSGTNPLHMPTHCAVSGHSAHVMLAPPHHLAPYIPIVAGPASVMPVLHPGSLPTVSHYQQHSGGLLHHSLSAPSAAHSTSHHVTLHPMKVVDGNAGIGAQTGSLLSTAAVSSSPAPASPTVHVPASRKAGASWIRDPQNVVRNSPSGPLHHQHHPPRGSTPLVSSIASLAASQSLSQRSGGGRQQTTGSSTSALESGEHFVPLSSQHAERYSAGSHSTTPRGGVGVGIGKVGQSSGSTASTPKSVSRETWQRSGAHSKDMYDDVLQRDDAFGEDGHRRQSSCPSSRTSGRGSSSGRGSAGLLPVAVAHSDPTHDGQKSPALRRLTGTRSNEERSHRNNLELFDRAVIADDFEHFVQRLASQNSEDGDEGDY